MERNTKNLWEIYR